MGQILFKTLVGAVAGFLAWMLWEPSAPTNYLDKNNWAHWELLFLLTLCLFIGLAVGGVNGWTKGSRMHAIREGLLGALFGTLGGGIGISVGSELMQMAHTASGTGGIYGVDVAARVLALAPVGLFIGAGIGAATLSLRGVFQGAIGGGMAGAIAGGLFDTIGKMVAVPILAAQHAPANGVVEVGGPSRAVMAVLLGAGIGLFIGLAERVLRSAWVRLSLGKNEGKEWVIDRPQVLIGRSETAQIPLFGDPNIAPAHAYILHKGGAYILADAGSPLGVYLNGQRVGQAPLFHGAHIQVGSTVLEFLMRAGAAPQRGPEAYAGAYPVSGPGSVGYAQPPVGAPVGYAGGPPVSSPQPNYPTAPPAPLQPTQMGTQAAGPASRFALVALDGPLAGQRFSVGGPVELGRESSAVPMAYDSQASRRHATVTPGSFGVTVSDSNSTNGTFVNGQRVTQTEARAGDMLRVGQTTFRIEAV